jgi:hypothetical protein
LKTRLFATSFGTSRSLQGISDPGAIGTIGSVLENEQPPPQEVEVLADKAILRQHAPTRTLASRSSRFGSPYAVSVWFCSFPFVSTWFPILSLHHSTLLGLLSI